MDPFPGSHRVQIPETDPSALVGPDLHRAEDAVIDPEPALEVGEDDPGYEDVT